MVSKDSCKELTMTKRPPQAPPPPYTTQDPSSMPRTPTSRSGRRGLVATPLHFPPPSLFLPEASLGASRCDWASRGLSEVHNWAESPPLDRWTASIGRGAERGWPNLLVTQAETLGVGLRRSGRSVTGTSIWERTPSPGPRVSGGRLGGAARGWRGRENPGLQARRDGGRCPGKDLRGCQWAPWWRRLRLN